MPDLEITIGGRAFTVACQPGEEHFLRAASAMLDTEAHPLVAQLGRLPEARMLLMAGLAFANYKRLQNKRKQAAAELEAARGELETFTKHLREKPYCQQQSQHHTSDNGIVRPNQLWGILFYFPDNLTGKACLFFFFLECLFRTVTHNFGLLFTAGLILLDTLFNLPAFALMGSDFS